MKIKSNSQYKNALVKIEKLIKEGFGNLSKKETEQLKQTSIAVQAYEKVNFKPILYLDQPGKNKQRSNERSN